MERIYAIGDIHGCYDKLMDLMDRIDIDLETDRLVFLGDYVDRGPKVYEVVTYLLDLKQRHDNVVLLKGNHEEMLENYLTDFDKFTYLVNGGSQTLESYLQHCNGAPFPIPGEHMDLLGSLDLYYETEHYIFVHAGLREKIPLNMQGPDDLLWIRSPFVQSETDFGKRVVFGHTPFPDPLVMPNKIGIDTGAVYGNKLTCVKLPEIEFYFS